MDSGIIDFVLAGEVDRAYSQNLTDKAKPMLHRKIHLLALNEDEIKKLKATLKLEEPIAL